MIGLGMLVDEEVRAMAEQVQEDGRPLLGGDDLHSEETMVESLHHCFDLGGGT